MRTCQFFFFCGVVVVVVVVVAVVVAEIADDSKTGPMRHSISGPNKEVLSSCLLVVVMCVVVNLSIRLSSSGGTITKHEHFLCRSRNVGDNAGNPR